LFDQPPVVARAERKLEASGLVDRCLAVGGSFFDGVPAGGDVYLLKWILHDWQDAEAIAILRSCRRAMGERCVLIVVEYLLLPSNEGREGKLMDLNMMVITGGVERMREQFAALFEAAGFSLIKVTQTETPVCVIEGRPF
jgi:hypothetical protein